MLELFVIYIFILKPAIVGNSDGIRDAGTYDKLKPNIAHDDPAGTNDSFPKLTLIDL